MRVSDISPRLYARIAGILYLIIIVCGMSAEVFIRSSLIVSGDAAATANNILSSQALYRLGFAADSIMLIADVGIAIIFYLLLKPVGKTLSLLAAVFRLTQAVILGFNLLLYYAALLLVKGAVFTNAFKPNQLHALSMLFLDMHSHGYDLGLIFFAVSNLFLGYLLIRSRWFPSFIGYGLIVAALVYLIGSYTRFLFPSYLSLITPLYIVPLIVELFFSLWLLIKTVKIQ